MSSSLIPPFDGQEPLLVGAKQTVFLVDDDAGVRQGFQSMAESFGIRSQTFAEGAAFLKQYCPEQSGCLILDVCMPDMSGLDLQAELETKHCFLPIIFVSAHAEYSSVRRAFCNGAFDFLEKPFDSKHLFDRIQTAFRRNTRLRNTRIPRADAGRLLDTLTPREREVMAEMVCGRSIKQLQSHFGVSFQTVAKHRLRILKKMQCTNEVELLYFLGDQWVDAVSPEKNGRQSCG